MSKEFLIYLPYVICGTVLSIQDWKWHAVYLEDLVFFSISCLLVFIAHQNFAFMIPLVIFSIGGLFRFKNIQAFGLADYVVSLVIACIVKQEQWSEFFILSGLFGILCSTAKRSQTLPFITAMFMASFVLLAVEHLK